MDAFQVVQSESKVLEEFKPGVKMRFGAAEAQGRCLCFRDAVKVNGQTAFHKWEYFREELPANNSASALWTNIAVAASGQAGVTGSVFVAQQPEQFSYDPDGNLTNDGRWAYTWDAENRLISMTVNTNVGPQYQLSFAYDSKDRRIQKQVATNNGTAYVGVYTNNFVYDGWNLVAILNPQSLILESFVWGSDLSGSTQGAGGVGGLLEVSYKGSATTNCFPAFDGNGNVAALVNAADGTILANYEYGPFGEVIRATGPMAKANPFRFSTKYQDDESDLLYYGYRYYKASTGTWLSKDPVHEIGFTMLQDDAKSALTKASVNYFRGLSEPNLYGFVVNNPIGLFDVNGLSAADVSAITDVFMNLLKQMCQEKTCCPEIGWGQNLLPGYKGCRKQASQAEGVFDSLHYQDMWDISINYQQFPPHNTVDIDPRNPSDPSINIDTWRGCITYTYPPGSSETSYKSCFTCYSILNPAPPVGCSTCTVNAPVAS